MPGMEGRYRAAPAEPDGGTGTAGGGTRRGTARYSVPEAARALGISERAVRKRITAGARDAEKDGTAWAVSLPAGTGAVRGAVPAAEPAAPTEPHAVPGAAPGAVPGGPDLAPVAELIADLSRRNADLAASAALWQERARVLEGRLLALGAGEVSQDAPRTPSAPPGAAEQPNPARDTLAARWRRWWRSVREGP